MSDLQLGLIVVGILVVAGVYAFNRFQELQLRRRVESRFAQPPEDVLMRDTAATTARADDQRIEPSFGVPAQDAAMPEPPSQQPAELPSQPGTQPASGPVETHARPAAAAAAAATGPAGAASTEPAGAAPSAPEAPRLDVAIDYVCSIEAPEPIDAGMLERFAKAANAIGKPVAVHGWSAQGGDWVELPGSGGAAITRVQAALQLADRAGASNRVQLSSLRDLALQLAERIGGACRCADIDQAAKLAADIDRFCSQVDVSVGCNVVPRSAAALSGTKVRGLLESAGFVLEPSGRFILRAEDGRVLLCADDIEGAALTAERLRSGPVAGLSLTLDVPRVSGGVRLFERMIELARHLAHALDAVVVDDNRAELTEAGLKVIRAQLKSVHAAMEAQGIPAGGPLAARLFS
ncbi:MAG: cell division protein ZipA C-terminal FtsZ-binding domain-containing protein [Burkholderiales bacterium]